MGNQYYKTNYPLKKMQELYEQGYTQQEVADIFKVSQKHLSFLFSSSGYISRKPMNRNQVGINNPNWKGNNICYHQFHRRVEKKRGKPKRCSKCGKTPYFSCQWANIKGNYQDIYDYTRLCKKCHKNFDEWKLKQPKIVLWIVLNFMS